MRSQKCFDVGIASVEHGLEREDDVDIEQIMMMRHPLLCLLHGVGVIDIDLCKCRLSTWQWKEGAYEMTQLALDAEGIHASRAINR